LIRTNRRANAHSAHAQPDVAGLIRELFPLLPVYARVLSGGEFCRLRFALKKLFSGAQPFRCFFINAKRESMNRIGIMGMLTLLVFVTFVSSSANAYHRHHNSRLHQQLSYRGSDTCVFANSGRRVCNVNSPNLDATGNGAIAVADADAIIGARPDGCPHAYCGCGLRKYLGLSDVRLNLASNWARLLPRESGPRTGLAAVRNHHVMYIESAASNGQWVIRDYNSGGGLSRVHVRDLRGYVFVNPHSQLATQ
jgi:hypothetical protein